MSLERAVVVVAAAAEMERENCLLAALMGRKRRTACIWEEGVREGCKVYESKKRDATEREPSPPKTASAHWLSSDFLTHLHLTQHWTRMSLPITR